MVVLNKMYLSIEFEMLCAVIPAQKVLQVDVFFFL